MWSYQKKLQYPVNIKGTDPKLAQYIVAQYGGPYGIRYKITALHPLIIFSYIILQRCLY